jgi:trk system potassium uptake protein TrkA
MGQFAVIGLGVFGHYLATHLYDKGHDVLAIDKNSNHVQEIKDKVSQAVVADATDLEAVKALELSGMDAVVICIGTAMNNSILSVLNLADIGVGRLYAKALSEPHGRILRKIGATEVLYPEKDTAITLAERLHNPNMLEYLPFIEGYSISKFELPEQLVGKQLKDLDLINRYGIQVIAVLKKGRDGSHVIPNAQYELTVGDVLIVLTPEGALEELEKEE